MHAVNVGTNGKWWLLLLGFSCCILLFAWIMEPPTSIIFVVFMTALLCTYRSVRAIRYRSWNISLATVMFLSWFLFYLASVGPAVAFEDWLGNWTAPGFDALELFYFPLLWLSELSNFEQLLNSYVDLWEDYVDGRTTPQRSSNWSLLSILFVPLAAVITAMAFWKDLPEPTEKLTFREQFRFRLKTLLWAFAGIAVLLGCSSMILRWHFNQERIHDGRLAVSRFGGTYSMQSAVTVRDSGSSPSWLNTTFFNYIAEVDLSIDAWPITSGKKYPALTDDDLKLLSKLARLRSLDLHGRDISDQGVQYVKRLSHLRKLNIADTQVSDNAVNELQSALPECQIQR